MTKEELVNSYANDILPHLDLAKKAYGSRETKSPQHDASREYTRLLVEFYAKGGSLLKMAEKLSVTYAGIRRRVITSELPASSKRKRSTATPEELSTAIQRIIIAKKEGDTEVYHEALRREYEDNGISLAKIAKGLGLSSANPLYYGVARTKIRENDIV
jgi:hypothetical protein